MTAEKQTLQEEIDTMGLVEVLDTIKKVSSIAESNACLSIYTMLNKRLSALEKQAFYLIKDSHSHDLLTKDSEKVVEGRTQDEVQ